MQRPLPLLLSGLGVSGNRQLAAMGNPRRGDHLGWGNTWPKRTVGLCQTPRILDSGTAASLQVGSGWDLSPSEGAEPHIQEQVEDLLESGVVRTISEPGGAESGSQVHQQYD